jgi:hypothetical protein
MHSLFYLETALHVLGDTTRNMQSSFGWYQAKHVEQFPDKINCVTLHHVGYILEYSYGARTHER